MMRSDSQRTGVRMATAGDSGSYVSAHGPVSLPLQSGSTATQVPDGGPAMRIAPLPFEPLHLTREEIARIVKEMRAT